MIYRANLLMRGVVVPAGEHTVTFYINQIGLRPPAISPLELGSFSSSCSSFLRSNPGDNKLAVQFLLGGFRLVFTICRYFTKEIGMPSTINGIGTTYYGSSEVRRCRTTCPHCNARAEMTSYTTRLWVVVFFVPSFH